MLFLMLLLSLASLTFTHAECNPSISMSSSLSSICLGQSFSLSCNFSCLSDGQGIEIKKSEQVISKLHLSNTSSGSKPSGSVVLWFHSASQLDSGVYICHSIPPYSLSYDNISVTDCPVPDVPSTTEPTLPLSPSNSTQNAGSLESTLMWYLLCKTGVFLMCSMSAALKHKSHIC